jgi:hypothetical protein
MLQEIPVRLRQHAQRQREHAVRLLEPVTQREQAAAEADGVPALAARLESAQQRLVELDRRIKESEELYQKLAEERAKYASGKDENLQQSLATIASHLERGEFSALRRHAEATPMPQDDAIVQDLIDLDAEKDQLEESLRSYQQVYDRHLARVKELEDVRRNFKAQGFDGYGSVFANEGLIIAMLNEFMRGMASGGDVWGTVRGNHRRHRPQSGPSFGGGGFSFPSGGSSWTSGSSSSAPRSSGGGGFGGGGGFRTTGGF